MSASSTTKLGLLIPKSNYCDEAADFIRWAIQQLPGEVAQQDGAWTIALDEADRPTFNGQENITVKLAADDTADDAESTDWNSRFVRWMIDKLSSRHGVMQLRPCGQPMAVNDISERLFSAYTIDGGKVQMSGCQLTDRPFVRLSFVDRADANSQVVHTFVTPDGSQADDELVRALGLDAVAAINDVPPKPDEGALQAQVAAGRRAAAKSASNRDPAAEAVEPLAIAIVWVRQADGRLHFTLGEASAELAFSGWAKMLEPSPFVGRDSGIAGFQLSATDDERIEPVEAIAACEHSGRKVLRQDLVECLVTHRHVLPEFTETCDVTGLPALQDLFVSCPRCQQRVSSAAIGDSSNCRACETLEPVRKDDPRMVWILGEHKGLDRWNRWRLAETASVYIAEASSWTKQLLAVVEKETLAVPLLATRSRFSKNWNEVPAEARTSILS